MARGLCFDSAFWVLLKILIAKESLECFGMTENNKYEGSGGIGILELNEEQGGGGGTLRDA